jgi:hypothetical protein
LLNPDYRDILGEFANAGVEFLVVGAFALAAHGLPRATDDIKLRVCCDEHNSHCIITALARFGAPMENISAADFTSPGMVVQFGVAPRWIDVPTRIDGVDFGDAWRDRITVDIDGVSIPVISREHLLQNKRSANRPKDRVDAMMLPRKGPQRG